MPLSPPPRTGAVFVAAAATAAAREKEEGEEQQEDDVARRRGAVRCLNATVLCPRSTSATCAGRRVCKKKKEE
jgi:hypothetical protein